MTLLSTGYAGSADIDPENIDALLGQILPDGPLGMVFIPEGTIVKRNHPGLVKVVDWLQNSPNGVGVEGTIPVKNLVEALLERNAKLAADGEEEDELVLVLLYNPASGVDVNLAKDAHEHGIRVINLAAAGDDLTFEDPEPPADPEPAAEETPPFEPDPPKETAVGKQVREATEAGKAAGRQVRAASKTPAPEPPPVVAPVVTPGVAIQFTINMDPAAVNELAAAIVAAMGVQAQAVVEAPAESYEMASVTPIGTAGNNAADPAGQPDGTAVYYYNAEKATYRPARGTKRKGEERVFLTPEDITEAKEKGMIG